MGVYSAGGCTEADRVCYEHRLDRFKKVMLFSYVSSSSTTVSRVLFLHFAAALAGV